MFSFFMPVLFWGYTYVYIFLQTQRVDFDPLNLTFTYNSVHILRRKIFFLKISFLRETDFIIYS